MSQILSIRGEANIIKFYNISRLEIENFDISSYDLESKEDLRELNEIVNDFIESGEADEYDIHKEIHGVDPETCELKITNGEEKILSLDDITLKNVDLEKILSDIANAGIGEVFVVRVSKGDALWDFESGIEEDIDPTFLEIGYFDCLADNLDQYDVFRDEIYSLLCDMVSTDYLKYKGEKFELRDFVFHPAKVSSKMYIVTQDPDSGLKLLQKVEFGGEKNFDADLSA